MITIAGSTFNYREILKEMGLRYDGDTKTWNASSLSLSDRIKITSMRGVHIREDKPTKPGKPETIEDILADVLSEHYNTPAQSTNNRTIMHGDDPSWLNYFAEQNPISHFGFSSLNELTDYVKALPEHRRKGPGWADGHVEFNGTRDMNQTFSLAQNGWNEGIEISEEIRQTLTGSNAVERRRKYTVAGGSFNIGRLLSDNPTHMYSRPKQPGKKIITLFIEAGMTASVKAKNFIIRAGVIAAAVDILEEKGFSCEIIITDVTSYSKKPYCQIATVIKQAGEKLNLNDTVFALGHPSFARRLMFACIGSDNALRDIHSNMGETGIVFNKKHPTAANEFYIDRIDPRDQSDIDDDAPLIERAKQIWKLIIPNNLPITMEHE